MKGCIYKAAQLKLCNEKVIDEISDGNVKCNLYAILHVQNFVIHIKPPTIQWLMQKMKVNDEAYKI